MLRRPTAVLLTAWIPLLAACPSKAPFDPAEANLARTRAAALFSNGHPDAAREQLRPLVEHPDADPMDLVRAAIIELDVGALEASRPLLEAALAAAPELPEAHYNLGVLAADEGSLRDALGHFRRAHALVPEDFPTKLAVANSLQELDDLEEAERIYRELVEVGPDVGGSWYLTTLHRLAATRQDLGDDDEFAALSAQEDELKGRGIYVPSATDLRQGNLGKLVSPHPAGTSVPAPSAPRIGPGESLGANTATGLAAVLVFEDWFEEKDAGGEVVNAFVGRADILAWGPDGVVMLDPTGESPPRTLLSGPADGVVALDLEHDGDLDLLVARGTDLGLFRNAEGAFERYPSSPGELPHPPADVEVADLDHDGDLDVIAVGAFGVRVFRNDGVLVAVLTQEHFEPGPFTDVTEEAGMPAGRAFTWVVAEDYDTDRDVDLLLGGPDGAYLADSLRGGLFADGSDRLPAADWSQEPLVADVDGDAIPDLWTPGRPPVLWRARLSGRYERAEGLEPGVRGPLAEADLDADGALDVLGSEGGRLALGLPVEARFDPLSGADVVVAADLGAGPQPELASLGEGGVFLHTVDAPQHSAVRLALIGSRDNRRGVGAVVEVLAGPVYRRIFWRGEPRTIGIGTQPRIDVLRVTWPNGVVQHETDVPAGSFRALEQRAGLEGSCPFLYTWNGETYEFVTDVIGITPLGLPMAPGQLVPPDHDEYVLVRGDQLSPRDGQYELQFTEELREVTYLDQVRLLVVDHPAGTGVWPNERFTFPPFPQPHIHTTRALHGPARATGSDGRDWAPELAEVDGTHAAPFTPLDPRFQGLATPHTLELAFDPALVRGADRLRLVMTGWFFWTVASVNVAAARTPGVDFVPPILQVPDGAGGWRDAGPPIGFPAGKTKSMVVDVTDLLDPDDPRLRLFSTLRLYWDSIRLSADEDDVRLEVTTLAPVSARLWERGYSMPTLIDEELGLEWFSWEQEQSHPRWDQHPGLYTRHGEVLPLVGEVDDMFVVMGAGDALTVAFDAGQAPPLADGWTRDYLVFLDGWAKDRDPNTVEALFVEPLPFHGMSGYPYGDDEAYPRDEAHRAYRRQWNTRPARQWLEPLAPLARALYVR